MSINSLTDSELNKHLKANGIAPLDAGNPVGNALSMLVKYIPTESVTLYVGALSAAPALKTIWIRFSELAIYWFFGVLTPLLVLLIYFGKRRIANLSAIPPLTEWPWWKTIAATIAFLVWALAVPSNPYVKSVVASAVIGFLAIFVSTMLSVLEPLFDRP